MQGEPIRFLAESPCAVRSCNEFSLSKEQGGASGFAGKSRVARYRDQELSPGKRLPDTDKRARLIAQSDLFAGGSVRLPRRARWLEEFTAELLAFPGHHDDQVDALAQGLEWGRQSRGVTRVSTYLLG